MGHPCTSCVGVGRCCRAGGGGSCSLLPGPVSLAQATPPSPGLSPSRKADFSTGSCSDGLVSSQALDVTSHDGAGEQSRTVSRGRCAAKSGNRVMSCALQCCWGGRQPRPLVYPLGIMAGRPSLVLQVTLKYGELPWPAPSSRGFPVSQPGYACVAVPVGSHTPHPQLASGELSSSAFCSPPSLAAK